MTHFLLYAGAFILVLVCVITIHEAGHFVVAKLSGIKVEEFSLGFGPKVLSQRMGETLYSVRAIPAGGFVRMAGMLGLVGEADAGERNFYRASRPRRFATVAAGIVSNFVFAALCFALVLVQPQPWSVQAHNPAANAGVQNGDHITSIDGMVIRHDNATDVTNDLRSAVGAAQGRPLQVAFVSSDGAPHAVTVTPELVILEPGVGGLSQGDYVVTSINGSAVGTGDPAALLGGGAAVTIGGYGQLSDGSPGPRIAPTRISGVRDLGTSTNLDATTVYATWRVGVGAGHDGVPILAAVGTGFTDIPGFIGQTVSGVYQLVTGQIPGGINGPHGFTGPVGIAQETATATDNGFLGPTGLVYWIAFISMNLGFVNMLPIPFLDGGKLLFVLIEAVRRKRLSPRVEAVITAVGLAFILLFAIYVTIGDVSRL